MEVEKEVHMRINKECKRWRKELQLVKGIGERERMMNEEEKVRWL